jgi:cell wall-associated NlpC family hydrolase
VTGADLANAASSLVGSRFRLHGRDPATGLDCIGLFAAAMAACGRSVALPNGYALRTRDPANLLPEASRLGFEPAASPMEVGDVLLFAVGPAQFHLGIAATGTTVVHAHAGLRRVVSGPPDPRWAVAGHWRLTRTR